MRPQPEEPRRICVEARRVPGPVFGDARRRLRIGAFSAAHPSSGVRSLVRGSSGISGGDRTLSVCYTRNFTRHDVCVLTSDLSYSILETPFGVSSGLCNLSVHLPCRVILKVRSILTFQAADIPFTL